MFASEKGAVQVDVERQPPFLQRRGRNGSNRPNDAGIVVHDVELRKVLDRRVDKSGNVLLGSYVATYEHRRVAKCLRHRTASLLLDISQDHPGTFRHKTLGRSPAKTAGTTGDGGHLAFESHLNSP